MARSSAAPAPAGRGPVAERFHSAVSSGGGRLEVQRLRVGHGQGKPGAVECVGRDDEPELRLRASGTRPARTACRNPAPLPVRTAPLSRPGPLATLTGSRGRPPSHAHVLRRGGRDAARMRGSRARTSAGGTCGYQFRWPRSMTPWSTAPCAERSSTPSMLIPTEGPEIETPPEAQALGTAAEQRHPRYRGSARPPVAPMP